MTNKAISCIFTVEIETYINRKGDSMSQKTIDMVRLRETIIQIPVEELPQVISVATGVVIDDIETEQMIGDSKREYYLHLLDVAKLLDTLRAVFRDVPGDQVQLLVNEARRINHQVEFGHKDKVRQARPGDPYWYEGHLLTTCRALLAEGKPERAFSDCLIESNHGHSGFVDQVQRVYFAPENSAERQISSVLRALHIDVARALLETVQPTASLMNFMDVEVICTCLERLGRDYPTELAKDLNKLIADCLELDPKFDPAVRLSAQVKYRFKV